MTDSHYVGPALGTADHAALITHGRHPGVVSALAWLAFSHLPLDLQSISEPTYVAALELLARIPTDSPELVTGLNRLVDAKDSLMRAGIRNDYGKPGPVPRPQTVVDPPTDWAQTARDLTSGDRERIEQHLPEWPPRSPILPGQSPDVVDPAGDPYRDGAKP